jgi:transposase
MKSYSLDLRQKVLDAHTNKEGSQRKLAQRFKVSLSFVQDLLKRHRTSGTIHPKPHGGGPTPKLTLEQKHNIQELVEQKNDMTLDELCECIEKQTQVRVSRSTMGRIVQSLNFTRKKNFTRQ